MDIQLLNPLSAPDWDHLASSHPDATPFHSTAWARVLSKTYRHEPLYLHCSLHGELVALLPIMEVRSWLTGRRGVSLPFSDLCAPLIFNESHPGLFFEPLCALAEKRRWRHFELRGGKPIQTPAASSVTFYGHVLDLQHGVEELFTRFTGSVRRGIRKAESSGLDVRVSQSWDVLLDFYRLHVQTRRRHGVPPQPHSFFRNIYEEIIAPDSGFVVTASQGSRLVAAAVFLQFGKKAVYKFGASDQTLQRLRGNNLVMWEAIKHLAVKGFRALHLGRTSSANEGLRRFKLGWGTQEEVIEYFKYDTILRGWITDRDHAFGMHNALFRRMPLALNRLAGAMIYPHLD